MCGCAAFGDGAVCTMARIAAVPKTIRTWPPQAERASLAKARGRDEAALGHKRGVAVTSGARPLNIKRRAQCPATFVWPSLLSSLLFPALLAARPIHSPCSPRLACFVMCCWLASAGVRGRTGSHRAFLYDPPKLARPLHLCRRLSLSGGGVTCPDDLQPISCHATMLCLAPRRIHRRLAEWQQRTG